MVHSDMKQMLRRLAVTSTGQDLLEYALLMGLIAVVAIGGVTSVGATIKGVFWDSIANNF